jgi:hypothetical protein
MHLRVHLASGSAPTAIRFKEGSTRWPARRITCRQRAAAMLCPPRPSDTLPAACLPPLVARGAVYAVTRAAWARTVVGAPAPLRPQPQRLWRASCPRKRSHGTLHRLPRVAALPRSPGRAAARIAVRTPRSARSYPGTYMSSPYSCGNCNLGNYCPGELRRRVCAPGPTDTQEGREGRCGERARRRRWGKVVRPRRKSAEV